LRVLDLVQLLNKQEFLPGPSKVQADSPIKFSMLTKNLDLLGAGGDIFELGLSQALGTVKKSSFADFSTSKLSKVTQLTGFSDTVYAEAYVHVNQVFHIVQFCSRVD